MTDEEIKALQDERDGYRDANLKNQQGWDAEIQGRKQDAGAHRKAVSDLTAKHEKAIEGLNAAHQAALENDVAVMTKAKDEQHAAEIAKLKADVLLPAMNDLHARQQADLAAQHAAELAKLQGAT